MKYSDLYRQLDEAITAHELTIHLIEHVVTELDTASERLRRLTQESIQPTGPDGKLTAQDLMWQQCELRMGQHLNAARTALVREVVDYVQTLEAYHRASTRPLRPVH